MKQQPTSEGRQLEKLKSQLAEAEARLAEAEETLRAIRQGEVDALVVAGPAGDQVFTLQGAETPYRFLVEEMNEGALLLLPNGIILYANARFAGLTGLALEEIIGLPWDRFFIEEEQARARALLEGLKAGGVRQEFRLRTGQATRPVEVSLALLKRGSLEGYSVVITDLTQRKAAEEALRASNAKLRESLTDLEHFSYSLSHDMRSPLRAMQGYAHVLEEESGNRLLPQDREYLRRIKVAATRMDRLITDSLNYSRLLCAELPLNAVDLGKLLCGLVETYPNLQSPGADIQVELPHLEVLGNEAALTQIFSNLLGNAVKFVAPGVKPKVRVWAEPGRNNGLLNKSNHKPPAAVRPTDASKNPSVQPPTVLVWVEDNGIGIPQSEQERIFGMFQRMHGAEEYPGTGIGLAVVRKSLQRIGGDVRVESEPGKGSRFCVELKQAAPTDSNHR